MSVFLFSLCDWINFSSLPDGLRQSLLGDHNPFLRCAIYDLEGSNNVDPLVSEFGQIYLTVKYICLVVLLSVLIFCKQTRAHAGILLQNMSVAL